MKQLFAVLAFLIVLTAAPLAQAQLVATEKLDHIVAVVEEDVILESELNRSVSQIAAQYQRNPSQLPPRNVLERQVLERLILTKLQVQRADSAGIRVGDIDVDQAIASIARQNNMTVDQLRGSLVQEGLSYDEFRRNLHDEIMTQRMRQKITQGAGQVSESEIDIMLAGNSLKTGELHLSHILITVPESANADQIQAARTKAEQVKKEIDGGLDFNAAAIRYSGAQDALDGGDLGWRRYDQVPSAFADLVEGLKAGDVTQPVRGPSGFHILKVVDMRGQGKQVVTEYHARHVMIRSGELTSSDDAQKKVTDVRKRIVEGNEDFAKLAKQYSEDPGSANAGGDMGWFNIDAFAHRTWWTRSPC